MKKSLDGEKDGSKWSIDKSPISETGANSGGVDALGVLDSRLLPDREFIAQWEAVIVDPAQKERLLSQAILNFTLRDKVNRSTLPLHGLIVLTAPPERERPR